MKKVYQISILIILSLFLVQCKQEDSVNSPMGLLDVYMRALERNKFELIKLHWIGVKELNKCIEIMPELKRYYNKGDKSSMMNFDVDEEHTFQRITEMLKKENLNLTKYMYQGEDYRKLFKKQGLEFGLAKRAIEFSTHRFEVTLGVLHSNNHLWYIIGIYSVKMEEKENTKKEI